jgi:hypothetical protein
MFDGRMLGTIIPLIELWRIGRAVLGVYAGIRRMLTSQFLKWREVGARAYAHFKFCGRQRVYSPLFLAIHH